VVYTKESNTLSWCKVDESNIIDGTSDKPRNIQIEKDIFIELNMEEFKQKILSNLDTYITLDNILKFEISKLEKDINIIIHTKIEKDNINIKCISMKDATNIINNIYEQGYIDKRSKLI
jgi:hypothetical protein